MRFLFELHGIQALGVEGLPAAATVDSLARALQRLDGCTAPAVAWEADILPARLGRFDPAWLDQLCISGKVCWGRILQTRDEATAGRRSGPVKSSPMNLVQRDNLDLWQALAGPGSTTQGSLSSGAGLLLEILQQRGASFFADLVRHSGLLALQVE